MLIVFSAPQPIPRLVGNSSAGTVFLADAPAGNCNKSQRGRYSPTFLRSLYSNSLLFALHDPRGKGARRNNISSDKRSQKRTPSTNWIDWYFFQATSKSFGEYHTREDIRYYLKLLTFFFLPIHPVSNLCFSLSSIIWSQCGKTI